MDAIPKGDHVSVPGVEELGLDPQGHVDGHGPQGRSRKPE